MSDDIEMTGFASVRKKVVTVDDLRALVQWLDRYKVDGSAGIDWGRDCILYVDLVGPDSVPASWIECGDHMVGDERFDIIIDTHTHPEHERDNGPDNYEEAREVALERKPARFDWPTRDRMTP